MSLHDALPISSSLHATPSSLLLPRLDDHELDVRIQDARPLDLALRQRRLACLDGAEACFDSFIEILLRIQLARLIAHRSMPGKEFHTQRGKRLPPFGRRTRSDRIRVVKGKSV